MITFWDVIGFQISEICILISAGLLGIFCIPWKTKLAWKQYDFSKYYWQHNIEYDLIQHTRFFFVAENILFVLYILWSRFG